MLQPRVLLVAEMPITINTKSAPIIKLLRLYQQNQSKKEFKTKIICKLYPEQAFFINLRYKKSFKHAVSLPSTQISLSDNRH